MTLKRLRHAGSARLSAGISGIFNRLRLRLEGCRYGKKLRTNGRLRIRNDGKIVLGSGVTVNSSVMSDPLGGSPCTVLVTAKNGEITIGDRTGLSNTAIFAFERVTVGCDVRIGAGVKIYDGDFHPVGFSARMADETGVHASVTVEDGVFLGAHSVIGAGSVVTCDIPAGQVWAGNPARFIRTLDEDGAS